MGWHFNLALALIEQRDLKQAVNELRQAAKLGPGRAPVHMALGIALQEMGQLPSAETERRPHCRLIRAPLQRSIIWPRF